MELQDVCLMLPIIGLLPAAAVLFLYRKVQLVCKLLNSISDFGFDAIWPDVQVAEMFGCINHVCINHVYIHDCHDDVGSQNAFWLCYMANDLYA